LLSLQDASTDDIASAVWAIREKETEFRNFKRLAGDELNKRMDMEGKWTHSVGAYQIKGESPAPAREVDVEPLREELRTLEVQGRITAEARDRALETVITFKPKWSGIDALRKLGGEVKERIDKHIREVDKVRRSPSVSLVRPEPPK
jgi:hypothetical protein